MATITSSEQEEGSTTIHHQKREPAKSKDKKEDMIDRTIEQQVIIHNSDDPSLLFASNDSAARFSGMLLRNLSEGTKNSRDDSADAIAPATGSGELIAHLPRLFRSVSGQDSFMAELIKSDAFHSGASFATSEDVFKSSEAVFRLLRSRSDASSSAVALPPNTASIDDTSTNSTSLNDFLQKLMNSSAGTLTWSRVTDIPDPASQLTPTGSASPAGNDVPTSSASQAFLSRSWANDFAQNHVDVNVTDVFISRTSCNPQNTKVASGDTEEKPHWAEEMWNTLPGKSHKKKDSDSCLPQLTVVSTEVVHGAECLGAASALASLQRPSIEAQPSMQKPSIAAQPSGKQRPPGRTKSAALTSPRGASSVKKASHNRRQRPNYEPEAKEYSEPNENDVLLGRGGRTNNHHGNKLYLKAKEEIQDRYLAADKNDKTVISQELVDKVHGWGGRFLKLDEKRNEWYEVLDIVARKKASQTLREVNSAEEREAKRRKYKK